MINIIYTVFLECAVVVSIIGGIASKFLKPEEEIIRIEEKKDILIKTPTETVSGQLKYCPECGQKKESWPPWGKLEAEKTLTY